MEGDMVYLKRIITPPSVMRIVAEAREGKPMSMGEINEAVHEVRRQRKAE